MRAAQQLKVSGNAASASGKRGMHEHMRAAKTEDKIVMERGNVITGSSGAPAQTGFADVSSGPYQAHAPFGPNCAVADVKADSALVMCSTQDVYGTRDSVSRRCGHAGEKIRVQYYEGSGTYGHSCYDDVAQAVALLSQLAGKPVRLQFMRWDEHGWDNPGRLTSAKCAPPPMPTEKSWRMSIRAGSMAGATPKHRRNYRNAANGMARRGLASRASTG